MPVNHEKEYLIFVQAVVVFLPLKFFFKMAAIVLFLKKKISNLKFISFLTYIFRKWVGQLEFQKTGLLYYLTILTFSNFVYVQNMLDNLFVKKLTMRDIPNVFTNTHAHTF